MQPVITAAEARALDAAAMTELGLPGAVLMETAGRGVAAAVVDELAGRRGPVVVVCGGGGNGGDGYVVARALAGAGVEVAVVAVVAGDALTGDARLYRDAYLAAGGAVHEATDGAGVSALRALLTRAAIVVDAIFGVGLTRPVAGHLADAIAAINAAPGRRIAIDVPSGLHADTGATLGCAVAADRTVTMALPKLGLVGAPGCATAGRVTAVDIGIAPRLIAALAPRAAIVEATDVVAALPRHGALVHKHRRGHVLVVAGSPGKRGAGRLAAMAALRAGSGLVTLAGPAEASGELTAPDPIMTAVVTDGGELAALVRDKAAIAIGPGLPEDDAGARWVAAAIAAGRPCVVDATGLAHAAAHPHLLDGATAPVVITPHPGEAARLLGLTTAAVEADRPAAVRALAQRRRVVAVLKGARTLVCDGRDPRAMIYVVPTGGPALATAGTGDVLAGAIAALLAQGLDAATAAWAAAYLHGAAGDALAARYGLGVIASDLPVALAEVAAALVTPAA